MIITRFAPSPTGYLHIGGARTALFNYLFARNNNGKFLLRIEDTDQARSTTKATEAIFKGLKWLGLDYDDEVVYQSKRQTRYSEAVLELLKKGKAYPCYSSQSEIDELRAQAIENKTSFIFKSKWRHLSQEYYPKDVKPVVRLKAPELGQTIIDDKLQGKIVIENNHLDDMVLQRSDGSATYMLAVVVDDHDMNITHIIRGDDHLTNAARQILIYQAFGWNIPEFVHIPLIHGADGAKLSKRHGALGVEEYEKMGYIPEAINNYLLKLGFSHGDDEIINQEQAIRWFSLNNLTKAAARIDFAKLNYLNAHYIREMDSADLLSRLQPFLTSGLNIDEQKRLSLGLSDLKLRAHTLVELADLASIYFDELTIFSEAMNIIKNSDATIFQKVIERLTCLKQFTKDEVQNQLKDLASSLDIKIGKLMEPVRASITGLVNSPSVFEIISILGKDITIARLRESVSVSRNN